MATQARSRLSPTSNVAIVDAPAPSESTESSNGGPLRSRINTTSMDARAAMDGFEGRRRAPADSDEADEAGDAGVFTSGPLAYVVRRDEDGNIHLASAWPLWALLVPFPLWWALGFSTFIFPIVAVPMVFTLVHRRPLRLPPGYWLWALFLVWTVLSLVMFPKTSSGLHPGSLQGRVISTLVSLVEYASVTVTLLFVGNLTRRELPIRAVVRWLGVLFVVTVGGGVLGTVAPHFGFKAPLEFVIPHSLRNAYVTALVHPNAAQVQAVLGDTVTGRAAAPFGYTNFWANNISLLLIWFVCGWGIGTRNVRKIACMVIIAIAVVPIVYSLNRGLWIGIGVSILWVAIRLFLHGKVGALFAIIVAVSLGAVIFTLTPLHSLFGERIAHPHSNSVRTYLTNQAIDGAKESPLVGWGGSRKSNGSNNSIAIGKSPSCHQCGDFPIGSNGQLWSVLFSQGFLGAAFFVGFFSVSLWVYRRDRSTVGQAGVIVVALTFVYMLFYNSVPSSLTITMISIGLLWRSREESRADRNAPVLARTSTR